MQLSHFRSSAYPALLSIVLTMGALSPAQPQDIVEAGSYSSEAGHAFHYMTLPKAKEVAIVISWPSDWLKRGGAVATPVVGSRLLLNSGAGERDAATLAADFQDLNAGADIENTPDAVLGTLVVPPEHLADAVSLGQDVLTRSHLDDRWKKRLQQNLKADLNDDGRQLSTESWDTIRRFILGNGRLNDFLTRRPVSLIDEVTSDDVQAWYAQTFTRSGIRIAAAGPVEPETMGQAIDELFQDLPDGKRRDHKRRADANQAGPPVGKTLLLHKPDAEKTLISIAGLMPPARDRVRAYDLFAESVLGGGRQARLFDAVRTRLRASYGVHADVGSYDADTRLMFIFGEIDERHIEDAYAAMREAYETLRIDGITHDEFERTKEILVANFREAAKRPETMAHRMMSLLRDDDPLIDRIADLPSIIEAFTLDEVNAAIGERLPAFDDMVRLVTSPDDDAVAAACVITSVADVDHC